MVLVVFVFDDEGGVPIVYALIGKLLLVCNRFVDLTLFGCLNGEVLISEVALEFCVFHHVSIISGEEVRVKSFSEKLFTGSRGVA